METKLAETFLKVAELGNVTRSAEQLGYSQAAVTFQLKQLESEVGVQLFDRIGRGIQLTGAGRNFIPYAQALVEASNNADGFALDREDPEGTITIDCSSSLADGRLPAILIKFRQRYSKIRFTIRTLNSETDMVRNLRENVTDLLFITNRREEYPGCRKLLEAKESFVFAASPGDSLANKQKVDLREILASGENSPFIVSDREVSYIRELERKMLEQGGRIDYMMDISSTAAIINMIKMGYGRAVFPEHLIREELARGELCQIDVKMPELDVWSQLYCNENKWINPQMKVFIDFMETIYDDTEPLQCG